MERSFASAFRQSRLATFDRTLKQVYETPLRNRLQGDWGLKRNLPNVQMAPKINVTALDTAEHQTPWKSALGQADFIHRWKENFPNSRKPVPRPEHEEHNVYLMTPKEFKSFLRKIAKRAPAFQRKLKQGKVTPDQVFEYLRITFSDTPSTPVVGPTYSHHEVEWNYAVPGRYLNIDQTGHAIGIVGVVALARKSQSTQEFFRNAGDRSVRMFYVEQAAIDAYGRPQVVVRPFPPGVSKVSEIFSNELKADNMWNYGRKSVEPSTEVQNPDHRLVMDLLGQLSLDDKK